ncbi:hypothetical protein SDC9_110764 [bioreactor metagenome]|uniref:Uncharacterized protein n=1 Tax=bioreactor metagenome TaxID=1076179 RepID=A0A645BEK8_9ZZZZ
MVRHLQKVRQNHPNPMHRLIGTVYRKLTLIGVIVHHAGMRLHSCMMEAGHFAEAFNLDQAPLIRSGSNLKGKLIVNRGLARKAIPAGERIVKPNGIGQFLVFHLHTAGRPICRFLIAGSHRGHPIPHKPDIVRKRPLLIRKLLCKITAIAVIGPLCGVKAMKHSIHTGNLQRFFCLNFSDISVGNRAVN